MYSREVKSHIISKTVYKIKEIYVNVVVSSKIRPQKFYEANLSLFPRHHYTAYYFVWKVTLSLLPIQKYLCLPQLHMKILLTLPVLAFIMDPHFYTHEHELENLT
jgi:hypothetical protein